MFRFRPAFFSIIFTVLSFCLDGVAAIEKGATVGLSSEWEDNASRSSYNRESDVINTLFINVDIGEDLDRFEYGALYNVENQWYSNGTYDTQSYLNGDLFLNLQLIPQRFYWDNRISSAVTLRNAGSVNTPDNRDQRNTAHTSPRLQVIQSIRNQMDISAFATQVTFREADYNNSSRFGGEVNYSHIFTTLFSGGLSCDGEVVGFDFDGDYEVYSCYVNANRRINGGAIFIAVGQSVVNPELGSQVDGLVYDARLDWGSNVTSFYFSASRSINDTSYGADDLFDFGVITPPEINTDDIAVLTTRIRYELGGESSFGQLTSIRGVLYRDLDDLSDSDNDTLRKGGVISINRDFANELNCIVTYRYERSQFDQTSTVDYVSNLDFRLRKNLSQSLRIDAFINAENRRADLDVNEYEVYGVGASAAYIF